MRGMERKKAFFSILAPEERGMLDGCRQAEGEEEAGNIDAFLFSLLFASPLQATFFPFLFSSRSAPPEGGRVIIWKWVRGKGESGKGRNGRKRGFFFLGRVSTWADCGLRCQRAALGIWKDGNCLVCVDVRGKRWITNRAKFNTKYVVCRRHICHRKLPGRNNLWQSQVK